MHRISDSQNDILSRPIVLSVVIPCFNEEKTLAACVRKVLEIEDDLLRLELVIVNDSSTDRSRAVAEALKATHPRIEVLHHARTQGKGAAVRSIRRRICGDWSFLLPRVMPTLSSARVSCRPVITGFCTSGTRLATSS
jgi:cellulose synthase/poly-beta-1,6-N-acetylglucosamine synthase-like glycosyltransferase